MVVTTCTELLCKGDKACLGDTESKSSKSTFFAIELLVLELDFLLFDCKMQIHYLKGGAKLNETEQSMQNQHTPMILTFADELLVSFPPDSVWLLSLYFITNLLFSFSNMPFSTDSSLPYGLHQAKSVIPYNSKTGKSQQYKVVSNPHLLFSSVEVNP